MISGKGIVSNMKGIFKKKLTIVILLLTLISLALTGIILAKLVKNANGIELVTYEPDEKYINEVCIKYGYKVKTEDK